MPYGVKGDDAALRRKVLGDLVRARSLGDDDEADAIRRYLADTGRPRPPRSIAMAAGDARGREMPLQRPAPSRSQIKKGKQ